MATPQELAQQLMVGQRQNDYLNQYGMNSPQFPTQLLDMTKPFPTGGWINTSNQTFTPYPNYMVPNASLKQANTNTNQSSIMQPPNLGAGEMSGANTMGGLYKLLFSIPGVLDAYNKRTGNSILPNLNRGM